MKLVASTGGEIKSKFPLVGRRQGRPFGTTPRPIRARLVWAVGPVCTAPRYPTPTIPSCHAIIICQLCALTLLNGWTIRRSMSTLRTDSAQWLDDTSIDDTNSGRHQMACLSPGKRKQKRLPTMLKLFKSNPPNPPRNKLVRGVCGVCGVRAALGSACTLSRWSLVVGH